MVFLYKSKYQRHIESAVHRLILSFNDDEQLDETENSPYQCDDDGNESELDFSTLLQEPNTTAVQWTLLFTAAVIIVKF